MTENNLSICERIKNALKGFIPPFHIYCVAKHQNLKNTILSVPRFFEMIPTLVASQ